MRTPELRQFGELGPEDFERHPVWILCQTADYHEPWYEDTDEETFRPWTKELTSLRETLLVRADFELWDGSQYPGFVTPLVEGWDTLPGGRPLAQARHPFSRQHPNIFVGGKRFGFWGEIAGISNQTQRNFYAALGKTPEQIFPLRFHAEDGLANGLVAGQIDGFYRRARDGVVQVERASPESHASDNVVDLFEMKCTIISGYPQPESAPGYIKAVYSESCLRCGIHGTQKAPFRFEKSTRGPLKGFTRRNWVPDAFFVAREIANEISAAGITGASFGPAVAGRPAEELGNQLQMLIPTTVAGAESSRLPPVTCRSKHKEAARIGAMVEKWRKERPSKTASALPPAVQERFRELREKMAAIPFGGRVKHHSPSSLAIVPNSTTDVPNLFRTAEWFGNGACAFRLTLASRRFADLVHKRGWEGLEFLEVRQSGFSRRE